MQNVMNPAEARALRLHLEGGLFVGILFTVRFNDEYVERMKKQMQT